MKHWKIIAVAVLVLLAVWWIYRMVKKVETTVTGAVRGAEDAVTMPFSWAEKEASAGWDYVKGLFGSSPDSDTTQPTSFYYQQFLNGGTNFGT